MFAGTWGYQKLVLEFKPNNFDIILIEYRFVLFFYLFMFFVPTPGLNLLSFLSCGSSS